LELGVGTGETAWVVLAVHPGVRLVGIDESEPMLALARDRFPTADLRVERLEDPLPEGSYDLVISAPFITSTTPRNRTCSVASTQLRSGGRFVLADVVVPDDPEDAVTPIGPPHDKPSPLAD
jgi:tRNA (cmo5U34)-methyltransferase